ncbi:MAG: hypothetical protein LBL65_03805, partial [Campylobacteraceae bacterium]|nr:hypothetical protein [Campylobacteraceae bacterium]
MVKEFVNEKGSYSLNGFSFGFSWLQCGGGGKSNNSNGGNTGSDTGSKYVCTGGGEIKHGYQLPPCPDPKINDSTLLGIDTNNNGVRDDVEIWIYNTYDTYIPCVEQEVNVTVDNGDIVRAFKDVCE